MLRERAESAQPGPGLNPAPATVRLGAIGVAPRAGGPALNARGRRNEEPVSLRRTRLAASLALLTLVALSWAAPAAAQSPLRRWQEAARERVEAARERVETTRERIETARERWRAERNIELRMALGELRGRLAPPPPAPDFSPRSWGQGRLERGPGGVPILYLSGTPEEMGAQHGHLLGREVRALTRYLRGFLGPRELESAQARARELFLAHTPAAYLREAEALAAAAGLPLEQLLFAQWFTDMYRVFACTCVGAPSDEGPLLARNLDFPGQGYLGRYSLLVVVHPQGKRPYVSVSWPGLLGVLSGMNEGVALAVMVVHRAAPTAGVPFQLAFRSALEEAGDAAGVEAHLRALSLTVSNNLMVVDRGGAARVLELEPGHVVTTRRPDGEGRVISTNHFLGQPEPWRPSLTHLSSLVRYRKADRVAHAEPGPLSLDRARAALKETASATLTQQSMVFLPARGQMDLALRDEPPATDGRWVRLDVRALLAR